MLSHLDVLPPKPKNTLKISHLSKIEYPLLSTPLPYSPKNIFETQQQNHLLPL